MKAFKALLILLVSTVIYAGCISDSKKTTTNAEALPKVVSGDFNGDGKRESVQLIKPKLNKEGTGCLDSNCIAYIQFSDTTIKAIAIKSCIGGTPDNLGDLNGDGKDEVGLLPEWFTSCWREYKVYTYKDNEWVYAVPPIPTHCNQWEANVKPIEKDSLNKGYVIIHYSVFEKDSIKTKSKIETIK